MIRIEKYYELLKGFWVSISEHWGWGYLIQSRSPPSLLFMLMQTDVVHVQVLWLRSCWKPNKPR